MHIASLISIVSLSQAERQDRELKMKTNCLACLLLAGIFSTNLLLADTRALYANKEGSFLECSFPHNLKAIPSKRAFVVVVPDGKSWQEGGFRILPPSDTQRKKGVNAVKFIFLGKVGLFRGTSFRHTFFNSYF